MTKKEFAEILHAETISEYKKRAEDIYEEPERDNGHSDEFNACVAGTVVLGRSSLAAMTNALEKIGVLKFDD